MSKWREQYDRMTRWRERIAHDRRDPARVSDIFFAFAQTCYHIVDWLENDPSQPIRRAEAYRHVMASAPLSFCHDICQGSKHARLEQQNVALSVGTSVIAAHIGDPVSPEESVAKLYVDWEGRSVLAVVFADFCIAEWDRLLRSHGVL